jgi:lipopolysaccharide export system permease protein
MADRVAPAGIAVHYLLQMPFQALLAFPIAALLAAVFTVSGMTRHFEVIAAKAGGVSFHRLVTPILAAGLMTSFVALALTEIVPTTNRMSQEALSGEDPQRQGNRISFLFRGEGERYYRIQRLSAARGEIDGLTIEHEGTGYASLPWTMDAPRAEWSDSLETWKVEDGIFRFLPAKGRVEEFRFRELLEPAFRETPEELLAKPKDETEMGYAELGRYIDAIERSGGRTAGLRVEQELKVAFPFACFIIVLFGVPLSNSSRRGGASLSIGIALLTTIVFLILIRISEALGAGEILPPVAAAWLPNTVFFVAGSIMFVRAKT